MRTTLRRLFALAGVVLLASCGRDGSGTEPTPGSLSVVLATPHANDRAAMLTLTGPGIADVRPATGGYVVHSRAGAANSVTVAVFGALAAGPLVTFTVPDVAAAAQYTATLGDVADAANILRPTASGYSLTVRP
jgi:hypothetical protein